jgi:hypothetical protein
MSLDANIILRGRGVDTGEMFDSAQKGMNLRQLMNQAQQQEAAQAEQAQLQQAVRQNVVVGPDGQKSINHQAVSQQMMGVNPLAAQKYEREQRAAKLAELKSDVETKNMLFGAATVETWPQLLEQSKKLGLSGADKLPATITQPELDKMKMQGLDYAKQIDYAEKQSRFEFEKQKHRDDMNLKWAESGRKSKGGEALPIDSKAVVTTLSTKNANRLSAVNQLQSALDGMAGKSESEKLAAYNMLLKVMNSPDNPDAVGKEEAERLAAKLEFAKGNLLNNKPLQFGRDIEGFEKDINNYIQNLKSATVKNKSEVDRLMGREPQQDTPLKLKIGHEEDGFIFQGGDPAKQSSWKPR